MRRAIASGALLFTGFTLACSPPIEAWFVDVRDYRGVVGEELVLRVHVRPTDRTDPFSLVFSYDGDPVLSGPHDAWFVTDERIDLSFDGDVIVLEPERSAFSFRRFPSDGIDLDVGFRCDDVGELRLYAGFYYAEAVRVRCLGGE